VDNPRCQWSTEEPITTMLQNRRRSVVLPRYRVLMDLATAVWVGLLWFAASVPTALFFSILSEVGAAASSSHDLR
jgi:hypothetical protein